MNNTDLSSLDRFTTAELLVVLERRRMMRREAAAEHGRDSIQHTARVESIYSVMTVLRGRGITAV